MGFISNRERTKLAKNIYSSAKFKKLFALINIIYTTLFLVYILITLFAQIGYIRTDQDISWWMVGSTGSNVTAVT
jgi:hypothetical protein